MSLRAPNSDPESSGLRKVLRKRDLWENWEEVEMKIYQPLSHPTLAPAQDPHPRLPAGGRHQPWEPAWAVMLHRHQETGAEGTSLGGKGQGEGSERGTPTGHQQGCEHPSVK